MVISNVFNSIKEKNKLLKEINRLLSKGMSNIYLKVTIESFSKFSRFKKVCQQVSFGELQLIELNFKTCFNLKIRRLGAKRFVAFLLF